jgi:uncharacterized RDD family membrane protein YckC
MQRAGFGIRLVAALVDGVIVAALLVTTVAVGAGVVAMTGPAGGQAEALRRARLLMAAITCGLLLVVVAYTGLDVAAGGTVGKRLFKLHVASPDGGPTAKGRLLLRWALKWSPVLAFMLARAAAFSLLYALGDAGAMEGSLASRAVEWLLYATPLLALLVGIGSLLALTPRRQALHDRVADTVVLRPGAVAQGFAPVMPEPPREDAVAG